MKKNYLAIFALVLVVIGASCKKQDNQTTTPKQNIQDTSVCVFEFENNSKRGYINLGTQLSVQNKSKGYTQFEWYIDNNLVASSIELSSEILLNTKTNIPHELKLISIDNNGNFNSFIDSFIYCDTFSYSEICIKNLSEKMKTSELSYDTNYRIGITMVNGDPLNTIFNMNLPPNYCNIIPHCWTKNQYVNNQGRFFKRDSLENIGLSQVNDKFFINNNLINDYQFRIFYSNISGQTLKKISLYEIEKITLNSENHELLLNSAEFDITLR